MGGFSFLGNPFQTKHLQGDVSDYLSETRSTNKGTISSLSITDVPTYTAGMTERFREENPANGQTYLLGHLPTIKIALSPSGRDRWSG
ncbi:hypothetical protein AVEN_145977-1 [Araneus ventricosus]|uniref:Uncharacterized protein n=1 Tax=Araneus ventricosus TaxID=182803 RepID=A0A4Y2TRM8_ARAVE|nr:hypothetical protein AVEN_145977-1 [Araneus ventricosus]